MSTPPAPVVEDKNNDNAAAAASSTGNNKNNKSNNSKNTNQQQNKKKDTDNNQKKNNKNNKSSSSATSNNNTSAAATHVCVHFALATRVPKQKGGGIMSIGAVCFNPEKRIIVDTFERNVLPIAVEDENSCQNEGKEEETKDYDVETHRDSFEVGKNVPSSFPNIMNPDTLGYWGSNTRRKEYRAVTENAIHPKQMMKELYDFCKKNGGSRITMVCNPLGAFFSFILHYQEMFLPSLGKNYQNPPWGFGALCVRSFCSALLGGIPSAKVATHKTYLEWCEGFDANQTLQPIASAVVGAVSFINAYQFSKNQQLQQQEPTTSKNETKNDNNNNDDDNKDDKNNNAVIWSCPIPAAAAKGYSIPDPLGNSLKVPFVPPPPTSTENDKNKKNEQTNEDKNQEKEKLQLLLYPSITDADFSVDEVEKAVAVWANEKHPEIEWIAQEKVHGSNLSIAFAVDEDNNNNNTKIFAARREAPLTPKDCDAFFGFDHLIRDIKQEMLQVVEEIKKNFASSSSRNNNKISLVQFFGEICGGEYDDQTRVSPCVGAIRVQRGVLYSPWHCYYIFDCVIHLHQQDNQQQVARYLSYDELTKAFEKVGSSSSTNKRTNRQLVLAPPLARGSFKELNEKISCEFESKFHSWVGLPSRSDGSTKLINHHANFAEGIILRPAHDLLSLKNEFVPLDVLSGSNAKMIMKNKNNTSSNNNQEDSSCCCYRPLIKKKHPMFREFSSTLSSAAFLQNTPPSELFPKLVNVSRVASVISKMTKNEREDEERVVATMVADVVKDIKEILKKRVDGDHGDDDDVGFDEKEASSNEENIKVVRAAVKNYFGK